jgi:rubrerythrin
MKIKINSVITTRYPMNDDYNKELKRLCGKWVKVETKFLFRDQFNVKNLRIMLRDVEAIEDDIRPYRKRCNYCGHHAAKSDKVCPHCKQTGYFETLMLSKNERDGLHS